MRTTSSWAAVPLVLLAAAVPALAGELCGLEPTPACAGHDYSAVFRPAESGLDFDNLPGYTRSAHYADHALIGVESRVFAGQRGWKGATTAHLISPARGANFAMYVSNSVTCAQCGAATRLWGQHVSSN
jgi:(S)-ureidoglycine aminohydrolase